MNKKLLFANLITTSATSLDISVNMFDKELIAVATIFQEQGYRVYLHEIFRQANRLSHWPNKVSTSELQTLNPDLILIKVPPSILDYVKFAYNNRLSVEKQLELTEIIDFLWLNRNRLCAIIIDPRIRFVDVFLPAILAKWKNKLTFDAPFIDKLIDILVSIRILTPNMATLPVEIHSRAIVFDFWRYISYNVPKLNPLKLYQTVYVGCKSQTTARMKMLKTWLVGNDVWTSGDIKVPGVQSLSEHKKITLFQTCNLASNSITNLICGEVNHWFSDRTLQALTLGSIASIHPNFSGRYLFPPKMLEDQTFERASDFDMKLCTPEIYQRQVDFVSELKSEFKFPTII